MLSFSNLRVSLMPIPKGLTLALLASEAFAATGPMGAEVSSICYVGVRRLP